MSQWLHWNGLYPVWVLICFLWTWISEKALTHSLHWYGFSPVWIILIHWLVHLFSWVCISEMLFSSVYIHMIYNKKKYSVKLFSHSLHWYGLSPVCVLICPLRLLNGVHWLGLNLCFLWCLIELSQWEIGIFSPQCEFYYYIILKYLYKITVILIFKLEWLI